MQDKVLILFFLDLSRANSATMCWLCAPFVIRQHAILLQIMRVLYNNYKISL